MCAETEDVSATCALCFNGRDQPLPGYALTAEGDRIAVTCAGATPFVCCGRASAEADARGAKLSHALHTLSYNNAARAEVMSRADCQQEEDWEMLLVRLHNYSTGRSATLLAERSGGDAMSLAAPADASLLTMIDVHSIEGMPCLSFKCRELKVCSRMNHAMPERRTFFCKCSNAGIHTPRVIVTDCRGQLPADRCFALANVSVHVVQEQLHDGTSAWLADRRTRPRARAQVSS